MAPALSRRLASLVYEALAAVALVMFVVAAFSLLTTLAPRLPHQRPLLLAACFAVLGGYYTYCWRHGQTLAMRAWKMRVTDAAGARPGWGRACIRYLLAWVWVAPPLALVALQPRAASVAQTLGVAALAIAGWSLAWALAALLHPGRQFWHDAAAGTRIVPA